jgi:hypothetical protein
MVGPGGLEPLTSSVSRKRSNQLSYGPTIPFSLTRVATVESATYSASRIGWQYQNGMEHTQFGLILGSETQAKPSSNSLLVNSLRLIS